MYWKLVWKKKKKSVPFCQSDSETKTDELSAFHNSGQK